MVSFVLAFVASFLLSAFIVRLSRDGGLAWDDHDLAGTQKFHARPVPRVGGLGVMAGLLTLTLWVSATGIGPTRELWVLLICGLPALLAGLAEDQSGCALFRQ